MPQSSPFRPPYYPPRRSARRRVHHGPAVAGIALTPSPIRRAAPHSPSASRVLFMGNGINEDHWSAEGAGAAMKLSKTLQPLEPLKQKINVIDGLFNQGA